MSASFTHGSKATLKLGSAATPSTLVDYSEWFNSISFPQTRDTAETTGFTATTKSYIPGLRDATFSAEGRYHTDIDGVLQSLLSYMGTVSFEYCPAGSGTTGTPAYTGQLFITSYEGSSDISDVGGFSAEFQLSGDVVRVIQ